MPENEQAYEVYACNRYQLIRRTVGDENGNMVEKTVDVKTGSIWATINGLEVSDKKETFVKVLNTFRELIKEELI